ncbi:MULTISPECIES: hypothetical protein [unclassified Caballeronia]|uniref:hypothetical protein n=1 Tax=unclassified Caballeronia TaxID=2646786 RepID=UPI0020289BD5|nr:MULTISPECIES: hypothetical protein [unclassified Caballeronia]
MAASARISRSISAPKIFESRWAEANFKDEPLSGQREMDRKYVLVGFVLTFLAGFGIGHHRTVARETVSRTLRAMPAMPIWKDPQCVSANINEIEHFEIAASTLEHVEPHSPDWLAIGAEHSLSEELYRGSPGKLGARVCTPAAIYGRVAAAFAGSALDKGRFDRHELRLASHFQPPPVNVVDAVARVAFFPRPVIDDDSGGQIDGDIRPYAMTVLAGFGHESARYAAEAFEHISSENSLGTGAAQVAAAGGQPGALSRIESLMNELLATVPDDKPIPLATRDRLYELSWAISFSGESAKDHVAPIIRLMGRHVQSGAPPFGAVSLHPKRMCEVMSKIYGGSERVNREFSYCADDAPLESYPQGAFAFAPGHTSETR